VLSPVFGTRGSEVQILSPRPFKYHIINNLLTPLQRTRFARSPKKSPIRKGDFETLICPKPITYLFRPAPYRRQFVREHKYELETSAPPTDALFCERHFSRDDVQQFRNPTSLSAHWILTAWENRELRRA
jgi:hypothetical protein